MLLVRGVGYIILMTPEILYRCVVILRSAGECYESQAVVIVGCSVYRQVEERFCVVWVPGCD